MKNTISVKRIKASLLLLFSTFTIVQNAIAQQADTIRLLNRLNFIVSSKQKSFDAASFSFQMQAKFMRLFYKKKLYVIIASSSEEAAKKILRVLKRRKAMIGNIWFDSHGHWPRRRSLFEIGKEEFNYVTIKDSSAIFHLKKIGLYCDTNTKAGIGSCYGGATYTLPAIENFAAQKMNGDLLMIGLSALLNHSTVYACESFVMTPPGIMGSAYALSGSPGRKKFKDPIYMPVWENLGEWNCYSGKYQQFTEKVTVSLYQDGTITFREKNYLSYKTNKKKLLKKIRSFKKGNYNLAYLYQNH